MSLDDLFGLNPGDMVQEKSDAQCCPSHSSASPPEIVDRKMVPKPGNSKILAKLTIYCHIIDFQI